MQQIEAYGKYSILQPFYKALGVLLWAWHTNRPFFIFECMEVEMFKISFVITIITYLK